MTCSRERHLRCICICLSELVDKLDGFRARCARCVTNFLFQGDVCVLIPDGIDV